MNIFQRAFFGNIRARRTEHRVCRKGHRARRTTSQARRKGHRVRKMTSRVDRIGEFRIRIFAFLLIGVQKANI